MAAFDRRIELENYTHYEEDIVRTKAWRFANEGNRGDLDGLNWDWAFDSEGGEREIPAHYSTREVGKRTGMRYQFYDGSAIVGSTEAWDFGIHGGHFKSIPVCDALCGFMSRVVLGDTAEDWEARDLRYVWPAGESGMSRGLCIEPAYRVRVKCDADAACLWQVYDWNKSIEVPDLECAEELLVEAVEAGAYGGEEFVLARAELICPFTGVMAFKGENKPIFRKRK